MLIVRLSSLKASLSLSDNLIASAHRVGASGANLFTQAEIEQITSSAFLNSFIAWETFLEDSIADYLSGELSMLGTVIPKLASPPDQDSAKKMIIGAAPFFDYSNQEKVKTICRIYFPGGHPFHGPISSITSDLSDMKTIRNACAHLSSTTRASLEAVAQRILGRPKPGISPYVLLLEPDPRSTVGGTVYSEFRDKLDAAATMIASA
jgi:hypothetical protein